MPLRRDSPYANGFADDDADGFDPNGGFSRRRPQSGVRLSFRAGLVPKTLWGRIVAGSGFLLLAGTGIAAALWVRSFLLHDEHFMVPSSDSIQIAGNSHLTRPQLLSVFGEDVDRNIFSIPLAQRRAELESLPWVAHATVMRLLPNRMRVAIVERAPVAFVRDGAQIGLVDANGALFDLSEPEPGASTTHYSFPVLTGISAGDPLSTRAARMKIYLEFAAALDSGGENISRQLSEVDLSNPEDVRAIIPDAGSTGPDILVHFGEDKFLERYHQYSAHLAEWRTQYPKLASVDMRYERQVVLEMQPGSTAPAAPAPAAGNASAKVQVEPTGGTKPMPEAPTKSVTAAKPSSSAVKRSALTKAGRKPGAHPTGAPHAATTKASAGQVSGGSATSQGVSR